MLAIGPGSIRPFLLAVLCLAASASPVLAQVAAGEITGVVQDPGGAAVPGATITVTDVATNRQRIVVSTEVGSGIVPMHPVTRRYRDVLGRVNAIFADQAATVALMVAGRAMRLSTKLTDLEEPS